MLMDATREPYILPTTAALAMGGDIDVSMQADGVMV
jgi:hypothetical protein